MNVRLKFSVLLLALLGAGALHAQSELSYDTNSTFLKWPEHIYMGEPAGVAHNSKGHIFIYTRTGSVNVSTEHFKAGEIEFARFKFLFLQPLLKGEKLPDGLADGIQEKVQRIVRLVRKLNLLVHDDPANFLK